MKKSTINLLLGFTLFFTLTGCGAFVSEEDTAKAVEKQGYQNVQIQKKHIFFTNFLGCGENDVAMFKATATNSMGQKVDIIICTGWPFKGVTIRTR